MRVGRVDRRTDETEVSVRVDLDGEGRSKVDTGILFLDHMLKSFATHAMIDIDLKAEGDLKHHIYEDIAICLGRSLNQALGDRAGLTRFGYACVPMDSSLAEAAVDLVKRPYSIVDLKVGKENVEGMFSEDIIHFIESLASSLEANIHILVRYGENDHHKVEAAFKALALAFKEAASPDTRRKGVPSSKGVI